MSERLAHAKINLALVVGPLMAGGKHEVTTVLVRVGLTERGAALFARSRCQAATWFRWSGMNRNWRRDNDRGYG